MREIKQVKPFRLREEEVYLNLLRTTEALRTGENDLLKPFDLTPVQYNVLRILRGAESCGLTCSEISSRIGRADFDSRQELARTFGRGFARPIQRAAGFGAQKRESRNAREQHSANVCGITKVNVK